MASQDPDCPPLKTPFAQASWEPRFAIDAPSCELKLLQLGLQCCLATDLFCHSYSDQLFIGFAISPVRFAVASPRYDVPRPLSDKPAFKEASLEDAALFIKGWLENDAVYPTRPWFDGGELRGFQMFHIPYSDGYEDFNPAFGYSIVEPKWLELHK